MKKNLSGLASEPFMPYIKRSAFCKLRRRGTPTLPGPFWHKGPAIAFNIPPNYNTDYLDEEGNMSYGRIGDVPYSTVVGPVQAPNASFYRQSPVGAWPQGPVTYIPKGLPGPIYPAPGWHFGPTVAAKRGNEYVVSVQDTSRGMEYGADDDEASYLSRLTSGDVPAWHYVALAAAAYLAWPTVKKALR